MPTHRGSLSAARPAPADPHGCANDVARLRRASWLGTRLIDVVVCVFLLSALAKLSDLPAFVKALYSWDVIPHAAASYIGVLIPSLELTFACLWFLGLSRRLAQLGVAVSLVCFTGIYIAQLSLGRPPDCGCFGMFLRFENTMAEAQFALARNVILLAALCAGMWLARTRIPARRLRRSVQPASGLSGSGTRGFTLIEMVVVVAIIALLIVQLMPMLAGVRDRARKIQSLSNLRSHTAVFSIYTNDFRDTFPYYTDPDATYTILRVGGHVFRLRNYFSAHYVWNIALAEMYYDGNIYHPSFFGPESIPWIGTRYYYGCCFIAHPHYWNERTRRGSEQWRATHASDVLYPSAKGLLALTIYDENDYWTAGYAIGYWDGSADERAMSELRWGYPRGDGPGNFHNHGSPVLHTIDGVHGRDRD